MILDYVTKSEITDIIMKWNKSIVSVKIKENDYYMIINIISLSVGLGEPIYFNKKSQTFICYGSSNNKINDVYRINELYSIFRKNKIRTLISILT